MTRSYSWRSMMAAVALVGAAAGCTGDLAVENPNSPDAKRAFSDPATIAALASGSIRTWAIVRQEYNHGLLFDTMADSYTAAWNNFNIRYYASYGNECTQRCGWANTQTSSFYAQIETAWYGFYSALSSVNDALIAIRKNGAIINNVADTKRIETIGVLMQGVVYANIALNYDQGFIVDENTDLSDPGALPLKTRQEMRDAAIAKLNEAYTLATANSFTTPATWFGAVNGRSYTSAQLARLIRTMQAELLAQYPRNAAENGAVNWAQVATFASAGLSSAGGTDLTFFQDLDVWYDGVKNWGNDVGTVRVDTRVAAIITDGPNPAKVHVTPWPASSNPIPDAYDKRVGDGSWGPDDDIVGAGTYAETANAGTDFAYTATNPYSAARGTYHRSQLGHMRHSYLAYPGYGLPTENVQGQSPLYSQTYNDLLWAEGLLRSGGSKATAAQLINKTRVTRGGLSPLTGSESDAVLLRALQYEQEVELLGLGVVPFWNARRVTPAGYTQAQPCPALKCLWQGTPRHMPIPAKELGLLRKELYTFGGSGPEAAAGVDGAGSSVRHVRQVWADMEAKSRAEMRARRIR